MVNAIETVSSCQRLQEDLIIFISERGPLDPLPLGPDSLPDIIEALYLMMIRVRFDIIIIGSMEYVHENFPACRRLIDHNRGHKNA